MTVRHNSSVCVCVCVCVCVFSALPADPHEQWEVCSARAALSSLWCGRSGDGHCWGHHSCLVKAGRGYIFVCCHVDFLCQSHTLHWCALTHMGKWMHTFLHVHSYTHSIYNWWKKNNYKQLFWTQLFPTLPRSYIFFFVRWCDFFLFICCLLVYFHAVRCHFCVIHKVTFVCLKNAVLFVFVLRQWERWEES